MHHNESLYFIDGGRCSCAFEKKTLKSIRSNFLTRFLVLCFYAAVSIGLENRGNFGNFGPWDTLLSSISIKKGNKKCMWPWKRLGLLCPSTEQKMPDTLRIIKGVGWGRGLYISTTSSKQKMYSRSVFYAYNFFLLMEALRWPNSPKDIQKWTLKEAGDVPL